MHAQKHINGDHQHWCLKTLLKQKSINLSDAEKLENHQLVQNAERQKEIQKCPRKCNHEHTNTKNNSNESI